MQHVVRVPPVGPDVPTGQDSGGVLCRPPAGGHGPGGPRRPGAQYPQTAPCHKTTSNISMET